MKDIKEPVVEITPEFKVGEIVTHIGERTDHKIRRIAADGTLYLEGVAGRILPTAVRKK